MIDLDQQKVASMNQSFWAIDFCNLHFSSLSFLVVECPKLLETPSWCAKQGVEMMYGSSFTLHTSVPKGWYYLKERGNVPFALWQIPRHGSASMPCTWCGLVITVERNNLLRAVSIKMILWPIPSCKLPPSSLAHLTFFFWLFFSKKKRRKNMFFSKMKQRMTWGFEFFFPWKTGKKNLGTPCWHQRKVCFSCDLCCIWNNHIKKMKKIPFDGHNLEKKWKFGLFVPSRFNWHLCNDRGCIGPLLGHHQLFFFF